MYRFSLLILIVLSMGCNRSMTQNAMDSDKGWISLFDGQTLNGWKVGTNASSFSIEDGCIKVNGPKAHLYYVGDVENHNFKNFEFKTKVKTMSNSNSGIYIHTKYQETSWPKIGYEVQVNNTHGDWKKTGSLYDVIEVAERYVGDDEWFTEYIKVEGKRIIIKINDTVVVDYTEPDNPKREEGDRQFRVLTSGTFAFQAHDPKSIVYFKDVMVRPLP
ncbi:3-keto-disaccharide hydrolase [Membranihabitans marinus]|uniref:3-keto-disaccharide hydrolase n=1 Tax=Membranihabitans marinus TaxID=1227546 RepID=UPI001F197A69|nr:DUF1080 domain-containing protein [Membranihabitans marinus]